ncbi:MAG: sulfite exporter TauE/SafE family protein [Bacteroidetes bacterium]|nr:MAG: sulfite exporter TauE/SafE family protein [Bacteroidota bacterium]
MLWTAFILGVAGSLHCVAMCGPLMLALPLSRTDRLRVIGQSLVYQIGRILTYILLGVLFGLLGKGIALAGFQQALSIFAGILMLTAAFFAVEWERAALAVPGMRRLTQWVQQRIGTLLRQYPDGAALGIGMLNGLLPCGLVYAAIAGAISTTGGWEGGLFMALFGLGTLPLLLILMSTGQRFRPTWRKRFRLVQPALLAVAGVLLLSRGLHLDLSLFESAAPPASLECH